MGPLKVAKSVLVALISPLSLSNFSSLAGRPIRFGARGSGLEAVCFLCRKASSVLHPIHGIVNLFYFVNKYYQVQFKLTGLSTYSLIQNYVSLFIF
jgi:hypothetical protein